jgi:hypothetical protein
MPRKKPPVRAHEIHEPPPPASAPASSNGTSHRRRTALEIFAATKQQHEDNVSKAQDNCTKAQAMLAAVMEARETFLTEARTALGL